MSLTTCIRKAGDALRAEDKAEILAAAAKYRKAGMGADEAGRKAVDDQIAKVQAMLEAPAAPAAEVAAPAPEPATPVAEQPEAETDAEDGAEDPKAAVATVDEGVPPMPAVLGIPREAAQNAHRGTSHVPEVRAGQEQQSFMAALADAWQRAARMAGTDKAAIERITEVFRDVADGYRARYMRTLEARSRVMSSMIAGPARFPVERNRKRMETERKRAEEAGEYLSRGIKRLLKAARGPIDNSPESELESVRLRLAEREEAQEMMKAANLALRKGDDAALEDLGLTAEQIAGLKKGDFAGRKGFPDYKLTNNNSEIRRLRSRLEDAEARLAAAQDGPQETERSGVRIVEDAQEDRLRLIFAGKPDEAVRETLKANGFRWSPKAGAWQRQLTGNARYAAKVVLDKHFPADGDTRFSRKMKPEVRAANFDAWVAGAEMVSREDATTRGFKTGEAVVVEAYHGTKRPDRVGTVFQRKRATSGPMAFFTSDPALASSYAQGKQDTSLSQDYDGDYAQWFKVKIKGERSPRDIERAWWALTPDERARITELAPRVTTQENEDTGLNDIVLGPESLTNGVGSYDYEYAKTKRGYAGSGNPLRALVESWLASGLLYDEELDFLKVLKLAGMETEVEFDSPRADYPFVYKTFIRMANPLVTSDMPSKTMTALEEAAKRDRSRADAGGADSWDKNTRTLREWVAQLKDPERSTYAWTSIPDKVTEVLKSEGYDGIIDWSGKGGGDIVAPVYVPFVETQVKSALGNRGTFDAEKKDILYSRASTGRGITMTDARAVAGNIRAALPKAPPIILHESVDKAPRKLRDAIAAEGAERDVEAAYHEGEIHVFPAHIESIERMEFVVGRHEIRHYGIRAMLGPRYGQTLLAMVQKNPALREAARKKIDDGLARSMVEAADEALADMPVEEIAKLNGFDRFVAAIRQWLRDMAAKLRRASLPRLADAIDPKEWTDRDVAAFVLKAEDMSRKGSPEPMSTGGTMFGRRADVQAQAKALGLPATGTSESIQRLVDIAQADPATWTRKDFDLIAPYLSVHQDLRPGAEERIDAILADGLNKGMVDSVGDMASGQRWTWSNSLQGVPAYVFISGGLKYQGNDNPRLAAGNKPLFAITPSKGQEFYEALATARRPAGLPMFSRAAQTNTDAFRRWFGNSAVVNSDGNPRAVYHGTGADITAFDRSRAGETSRASNTKLGFFFTTRPDVANTYARMAQGSPNVMQAYLSIQNPLRITAKNMAEADKMLERELGEEHDGAIITVTPETGPGQTVFMARNPEQIKSATGNRGTFDPVNPDIRYSRAPGLNMSREAITKAARNTVHDLFADAGAKVSWWDKSIGTQYAKARKFPGYGVVFDQMQEYLEDVSTLANEAADNAPDILPKLEKWGDFKKMGIGRKDAEAIAAPIFQGTLEKVRYDDAALRGQFGLNDRQVAAYRQFFATVNTSLDQIMAAEVIRLLGDKSGVLRSLALDDRAALRQGVDQYLTEQIEANPADAELVALHNSIMEKYARIDQLKAEGYAPLMRFGKYKVHIVEPSTGQTKFFGLYESADEANRAARELMEDPEMKGYRVEQGVLSEKQYTMFAAVPMDSLEMFAEALGADQSDVFKEYIRLAKNNRSALKRLLKRKGTAGYSTDARRVLAAFVTSNARLASSALNLPGAKEAALNIRDGDVQDEAIGLIETIQNPRETAGWARGLMFVNFIGGSIASALVNVTQPLTMTLPWLSQFGGMTKAGKRLMAAGGMAATGKGIPADLAAALKRAEADGIVSPQEIHYLQAQAMGKMGGNPVLQRVAYIWAAPFTMAEQFNRRTTFIAAYLTAKEEKFGEAAFDFAQRAVTETQGLYNKGNQANWARNPVGAAVLTFKQFSVHYLEWMRRMWSAGTPGSAERRAGRLAVTYALAILIVAAGTDGLPFADDLDDLIDNLGQALGYDLNTKKARREFVANTMGLGDAGADVVARGFSAMAGIPFDVSLRMSMGNLVPGTGMLLRSNVDRSREVLELAGPAGGLVQQYVEAGEKALAGDAAGAVERALPVALQNVSKAVGMWSTGEARDTRGRRIMETDEIDGLMRFMGFNPQAIARESEKLGMLRRSEQLAKNVEGEIASDWARALADKNTDGVREAKERLADWNAKNPDQPIRITGGQILRRVRKLREDRATRFVTSASPERRLRISEALQ